MAGVRPKLQTPRLLNWCAQAISGGTHAPTDTAGYRTLVAAAVEADRVDLAVEFARHLLGSNLAAETPVDHWNVILYLLPADAALSFLRELAASRICRPDVHSYTAVGGAGPVSSLSHMHYR